MLRRNFLAMSGAGAFAARPLSSGITRASDLCGCAFAPPAASPDPFSGLHSGVKITGMKVFGVSLTHESDRPYVFVKIETNQGSIGWGEGTLEGKAGAVMACINDFRDFLIGTDPMQVEHHWQSMYVHTFYRAGPVIGSAISGIDQAIWDIRGKVLGMPVYQLLGGPFDPRGVRGYYHADGSTREELPQLRENGAAAGRLLLQVRHPRLLRMDRDRTPKSTAPSSRCRCCAKLLAPNSTSPSTSTPRPARAWRRSWLRK